MSGYEILEHTADVGLRAHAQTVTTLFEQTTRGLCDIAGIWQDAPGSSVEIDLDARDRGGLMVDWLNEVLYVHDSRNVAVGSVEVDEVSERRARGRITVHPLAEGAETAIQVKAVTYHQLEVRESSSGWSATVFFDI
jgi:SHS2 domain-containing protein